MTQREIAIDYDALDPGIRETVRLLNKWGFSTRDSGDGTTKIAAGWAPYDEALPYPHVFCAVAPTQMIAEAKRLLAVLGSNWRVQATYDPADESSFLLATLGAEPEDA